MQSWILRWALFLCALAPAAAPCAPVIDVGSAHVQVGDTFDIAIAIGGVDADPGLASWQFDLHFDPAIVSATVVTEGGFLATQGQTLFTPGVIDNGAGLISLVADAYVDLMPLPWGSGVLATITFTALADGVSALTPENPFLDFGDSGFAVRGGSVTVGGASVPEPGGLALAGLGLGLLLAARRWSSRRASGLAMAGATALALAACGGGGSGSGDAASPPASYGVTVTVSGLHGSGLVLQDNGGDDLGVAANGGFTFAKTLTSGSAYSVTVKSQPGAPAQTCTVTAGSGTVASSAPAVSVGCVDVVVDTRPLQLSLSPLPSAAMGVVAPYVLSEAQGIALTAVSWTFDGQPGSASATIGVALHVWNTPGTHTVSATATASGGRTATATMSIFAVSQPLAVGASHGCALTAARAAKCWGYGNSGALGNDTTTASAVPVDVTGLSGLIGLAAGDGHTCALKADGTVACWGDNIEGELGNASTYHGSVNPLPKPVDGLAGVIALAAGRYHNCALKADGTVACFGQNSENELGTASVASQSVAAVTVAGLSHVVAIAAGSGYFTCALKSDATVACWGSNDSGQLGNGNQALSQTGTPQTVQTEQGTPLAHVLVIRAGESHACAIVDDGQNSVYCWGHNGYTQVSATSGNHYAAVKVAGVTNALMLSLGLYSSCALDTSFAFRCWGSNGYGESGGNGATANLPNPTLLVGLQGNAAPDYAGGGNEHLCALRADGSAACVGRGGNGQLGNGALQDATALSAVSAAAGTFWHWLGP